MRIALFGGTFDPPHCGHIKIARAARAALTLDRILMAPVGRQPLKNPLQGASFQQRLEMVALAVADEPGIESSDADAPLPGDRPNYTLDTVERLRLSLGPDTTLFFLMGADSLQTFKNWHCSRELLFAAEFIIASRPGFSLDELAQALPAGIKISGTALSTKEAISLLLLDGDGNKTHLHLLPHLSEEISATDVRKAIGSGEEAENIVPKQVLAYIRTNRLYH